jgi:hypothetical protein
MRLTAVAAWLATLAVVALAINFMGATGGHCDESCSGNFPYWLFQGSAYAVVASVGGLVGVAVFGCVRWLNQLRDRS